MIIAEPRGMSRQPLTLLGDEGEFLVPKSYILRNRRDSVEATFTKKSPVRYIIHKVVFTHARFRDNNRRVVVCFSFFAFVYATSLFTEKARKGKRLCNKQQDM